MLSTCGQCSEHVVDWFSLTLVVLVSEGVALRTCTVSRAVARSTYSSLLGFACPLETGGQLVDRSLRIVERRPTTVGNPISGLLAITKEALFFGGKQSPLALMN